MTSAPTLAGASLFGVAWHHPATYGCTDVPNFLIPTCAMPTLAVAGFPTFSRRTLLAAGMTAFVVWALVALYWPRTTTSADVPQQGGKDLEAYRRIVARVHQGEDYYDAAGDELRAGGYATSSVFNWRPPLYAWLLAAFPRPEWGQALLVLLVLATLALAYNAERTRGGLGRALLVVVLMAGAFLWCIDGDAFFAQELWAGVLIAASVCAFANEQRALGVVAGLAALAMRELALPYVVIAMALAIGEKRWRETAAWGVGLLGWGLFFAWHAWQVHQHLTPLEYVEADGWLHWGGPAFAVRTSQMNVWLFNLPAWIALVYLTAALVGLARWRGSTALRAGLTVAVYLAAFLVAGKPSNNYWGLLYVALLPFGVVRCLPSWGRTDLKSVPQTPCCTGPITTGRDQSSGMWEESSKRSRINNGDGKTLEITGVEGKQS
jgi:hypothetical protein